MPDMLKRLGMLTFLAVLCFLCSCTMYSKPKQGFAGATGGEQLEKQFWDDVRAKNWKDLEPRLAETMVCTSPEATRDRAASLDRWKKWDLQSASVSDVQVQSAGADFIVTAVVTITGTLNGQPAPPQPVHTMTVWQQVSKGFVVVAHSDPLP